MAVWLGQEIPLFAVLFRIWEHDFTGKRCNTAYPGSRIFGFERRLDMFIVINDFSRCVQRFLNKLSGFLLRISGYLAAIWQVKVDEPFEIGVLLFERFQWLLPVACLQVWNSARQKWLSTTKAQRSQRFFKAYFFSCPSCTLWLERWFGEVNWS